MTPASGTLPPASRFDATPPASRVQFAFGRVGHARLAPARHAFAYRAWYLRVEISALLGAPTRHGLLGIGCAAPLSLRVEDHGPGSRDPRDLARWLHALLAEAGVVADGEIWLHAFGRTLGYGFKPVSFWHCHGAEGALRAIVAEVNNTFGERHVYLLAHAGGAPLANGEQLSASKSFHVSPFFRVEGSYRFRFATLPQRSVARIDYDDDAGRPLLQTSLSGTHAPAGWRSSLNALFGYPLFALAVIVRIHWHALRLWSKRIPFVSKPAAPAALVTRTLP